MTVGTSDTRREPRFLFWRFCRASTAFGAAVALVALGVYLSPGLLGLTGGSGGGDVRAAIGLCAVAAAWGGASGGVSAIAGAALFFPAQRVFKRDRRARIIGWTVAAASITGALVAAVIAMAGEHSVMGAPAALAGGVHAMLSTGFAMRRVWPRPPQPSTTSADELRQNP